MSKCNMRKRSISNLCGVVHNADRAVAAVPHHLQK